MEQLTWEEIQKRVGKPVYEKTDKKWRVISGYEQTGENRYIFFTDNNFWTRFENYKLYDKEAE